MPEYFPVFIFLFAFTELRPSQTHNLGLSSPSSHAKKKSFQPDMP